MAFLKYEGIKVDFTLREKLKQLRRPLTDKEKTSIFTRDKAYIKSSNPPENYSFRSKPTLESGLRHEWNETSKKSMEDPLSEIVALLTLSDPILVDKERERVETQRRSREEEHQRYLKEAALKKDCEQWQQFLDYAQAWKQAELARQFIVELEEQDHKGDKKRSMVECQKSG